MVSKTDVLFPVLDVDYSVIVETRVANLVPFRVIGTRSTSAKGIRAESGHEGMLISAVLVRPLPAYFSPPWGSPHFPSTSCAQSCLLR